MEMVKLTAAPIVHSLQFNRLTNLHFGAIVRRVMGAVEIEMGSKQGHSVHGKQPILK